MLTLPGFCCQCELFHRLFSGRVGLRCGSRKKEREAERGGERARKMQLTPKKKTTTTTKWITETGQGEFGTSTVKTYLFIQILQIEHSFPITLSC